MDGEWVTHHGWLLAIQCNKATMKTRAHPCTRPTGLIASVSPLPRGPGQRCELQLSRFWVPWKRRVAQEAGGERRACLSAGMREFAPADGFRATQGTSTASSSMRGLRVPFLLVTFLSGKQRKVTRWPEGTV